MRGFFAFRALARHIVAPFGRALWRGDPLAWGAVIAAGVAAAIWAFASWATRPLGGDPDKMPADDSYFLDEANPYRE